MTKQSIGWMLAASLATGQALAAEPARWSCVTAKEAAPRRQQVEQDLLPPVVFEGETRAQTIAERMAKHRVPAFSVAVLRAGRLDWSASWGRLGPGGPAAGCDSLFQAGSLAKPVTVLAALRLQQAGMIDLDRDVATYLSRYQLPAGKQSAEHPVTLHHLLAHTAGLTPGGYDGYAQGQALPTDVQTVLGEPPANGRKVEVQAEPGSRLAYSGGGYTVAEIALEDKLGRPFERLMQDWILKPAGMRQADFNLPLPQASRARAAHGHRADGSEVAGGWHNHPEQAAAGLWSTASDLAALLIELRKGHQGEGRVLDQALVRRLLARPFEGHAYGFRLVGEGDEVFLTHWAGTLGYRAGLTLNLKTGNGAVFMGNSDQALSLGLEFLGAVSRTYGWPVFREQQKVRRVERPAEALQALAGRYRFAEQGWQVSVVFEAAVLTVVFPNGDRYAMTPIEGGPLEFIHGDSGVRAGFDREGDEVRLRLYGQVGRREPAAAPAQ
ncbi:serine hydrolase domain-containing protein [Pelomonas sp. SE-A7]|uniref:serine hydrolase domain-containing protein n=1 Tax=Pelomonas sp. SE-A7 TaxID=3054953 RepID=UPI00259CA949|nr:serine hydrolase domain-containing protein [Pelomonas sp. SE-A7]MDM4768152.1 serine hydrolase domain-containing protein [Pelomonas sp. SE-A7]